MADLSTSWPPEDPELARFRGPHVAVDIAVLTVEPDVGTSTPQLAALLHHRQDGLASGEWALPGRMVRERERLHEAVEIALASKCGISGLAPRQLFVADAPTRDSRGWVMSVAHLVVLPWQQIEDHLRTNSDLALARISGTEMRIDLPHGQRELPFEHAEILQEAVRHTRRRYRGRPDPDRVLSGPFTLYQLRRVHEAILGEELDKDLFRRRMLPQLVATGEYSTGTVGKPAQLFEHPRRRF